MLLALDVGNTNTTLGSTSSTARSPELAANWRVTTHRGPNRRRVRSLFRQPLRDARHGAQPGDGQSSSLRCSPVDSTLRQVCESYFNIEPLFVEPASRPA